MRIILAILIACALVGCGEFERGYNSGYKLGYMQGKAIEHASQRCQKSSRIDTLTIPFNTNTKYLRLYLEPANQDSVTIYFTLYRGDSDVSFEVKRPTLVGKCEEKSTYSQPMQERP